MAKKSDLANLKNIGVGILSSIQGINEEQSKSPQEETGITSFEENNDSVNEENSKSVLIPNSKGVKDTNSKRASKKESKGKRSFMLSDTAIQRLNLLKLCLDDKDLSSIVEEGINLYFNKNKSKIQELVNIYDKVK